MRLGVGAWKDSAAVEVAEFVGPGPLSLPLTQSQQHRLRAVSGAAFRDLEVDPKVHWVMELAGLTFDFLGA